MVLISEWYRPVQRDKLPPSWQKRWTTGRRHTPPSLEYIPVTQGSVARVRALSATILVNLEHIGTGKWRAPSVLVLFRCVLRGTIVIRTYGTHKNLCISLFFSDNIWSYLLWSPVIARTDTCTPFHTNSPFWIPGDAINRNVSRSCWKCFQFILEMFPFYTGNVSSLYWKLLNWKWFQVILEMSPG